MEKPSKLSIFARHRSSLFVLGSQVVAALLHALARLLETGSERVHPFTVLQIRLFITVIGSSLYLWRTQSPGFPLGPPELRPLLALRAAGGVLGACGFYVSISYLSLGEATALNFLAPLGALILTRFVDNGTFTLPDRAACGFALVGVVFVLQPESIFGTTAAAAKDPTINPTNYLTGIASGIIGVTGGIVALSAISRIGPRVHPLLSVNWFGICVCILTTVCSFFIPEIVLPTSALSWCLLVLLGFLGLAMEYLLTAGLSTDASSGATVMIYSQVLWALLFDWIIWHVHVNSLTLLGCVGVIVSLSVVTMSKEFWPPSAPSDTLNSYEEESRLDPAFEEAYSAQISLG
ncbi:uncharacterized protein BCR38DRAFT_335478 [Pseudomassariella vexata]|uniref:EamA domain-containing protein n=1 Tax=Pseudomassariella vexata TaxID=1141098 RepID=A0A1Y2EBM8_9PEZI|nr:uncharacterized protein BCR38DRAFT_335478 [Pseudomassariella vexata]ORY68979.1 hypothetical protein BCR38DRAFT_335478 [Pseudomassariella vexata]